MPDSSGKRFILIHTRRHGFAAFEQFWDKMRQAFAQGQHALPLTKEEADSLSQALLSNRLTRRRMLKMILGVPLIAYGGKTAAENFVEHMEYEKQAEGKTLFERMRGDFVGISKIIIPSSIAIGGIALLDVTRTYEKDHLLEQIQGENKKIYIQGLVGALDNIFRPVEVVLAETITEETKNASPKR